MWSELGTKDRWLLVTAALQAAATVGTFVVAIVGIWKVTPIITYQVQQQEAAAGRAVLANGGQSATDRFVADAVRWWSAQVDGYQRILDLTGPNAARGQKVGFELITNGMAAIAPGVTADLLVVTSTSATGAREVIQVQVNEGAIPPSQYLQARVNEGAFAALDAAERLRVEVAVQRHIQQQMLPRVTPPHVRADMSIRQLHDEIALEQGQRVEALQHLIGLKSLLDAVMRGSN